MLCPRCYGKHVVVVSGSWVPCPECAGIGELHCCDGLREQGACDFTAPVRVPSNFAPPVAAPEPDVVTPRMPTLA